MGLDVHFPRLRSLYLDAHDMEDGIALDICNFPALRLLHTPSSAVLTPRFCTKWLYLAVYSLDIPYLTQVEHLGVPRNFVNDDEVAFILSKLPNVKTFHEESEAEFQKRCDTYFQNDIII